MFGAQPNARQINIGLLITRLALGTIFIAHGFQKLFVFGLDGVAGGFAQMGIPMAGFIGPFIAFVEFFGGIALVVGLLTRLAGVGLAATMVGAMLLVHLPNGFFAPNGIEFVLALFGSALTLSMTGAGAYSMDGALNRRRAIREVAQPEIGIRTQRVA